jgi:hypothetical protein
MPAKGIELAGDAGADREQDRGLAAHRGVDRGRRDVGRFSDRGDGRRDVALGGEQIARRPRDLLLGGQRLPLPVRRTFPLDSHAVTVALSKS